eukprot:scaffold14008_cov119-Isochrysis_galbana.AAC.3
MLRKKRGRMARRQQQIREGTFEEGETADDLKTSDIELQWPVPLRGAPPFVHRSRVRSFSVRQMEQRCPTWVPVGRSLAYARSGHALQLVRRPARAILPSRGACG